MATNICRAENLGKLVVEREVLMRESEVLGDPFAVAKTDDGGFVLAGSTGIKSAGATKIDGQGKPLWNYTTPAQYPVKFLPRPQYHAIAQLKDGSIYLCGFMNVGNEERHLPHGLLTHLDPNGKLLNEIIISPDGNRVSLAYINDCISWNNGLIAVGSQNGFHWVLFLDNAGNVKWEKLIPILPQSINSFASSEGRVLLSKSDHIVFSATDNVNTELISVGANGDVLAQKKLSGRFLFVHPVNPDNLLQVYGTLVPTDTSLRITLSLNDAFDVIQRVEGNAPTDFAARFVYRMPDQSLVLFGSSVHLYFGETYRSGVVHVDSSLHEEQSIDLTKSGFLDKGSIWAASPTNNFGEFITARKLASTTKSESGNLDFLGVVMNLIKLDQ